MGTSSLNDLEMSWGKQYEELLVDLRNCYWSGFTEEQFEEIAKDIKKTFQKSGTFDLTLLPFDFRWQLCASRLSQGKFDNWDGWEYRSNWSITFQGWNGFKLPIPKWNGQPVKKLVIASEQGLGDEILYGSAIPELMIRLGPKNLEWQVNERLVPVFERSFGIKCVPRVDLSKIEGDAVVALADLFVFYRRDKSHFPKKPFLKANPALQVKWLKFLKDYPKPWVGVSWKSRHGYIDLGRLVKSLDGTLVNLQYGQKDRDLLETGCNPIEDMDDHIALISVLDKVVSVTQTCIHEAGALGIPTDAIQPDKGTGVTDAALWYYSIGESPRPHLVYGGVTVWNSLDDYIRAKNSVSKQS